MNFLRFALAAFFATAGFLPAATIVNVGGTNNTGYLLGPTNSLQAAAASFRLNSAYTGVTINAQTTCISCTATAYLMSGQIGPTATIANQVKAATFTGGTSAIFQPVNLQPGLYFLVVAVTGGSVSWKGSTSPVITNAADALARFDYTATTLNRTYLPASNFATVLTTTKLFYTVSGTAATPEPSSGLLAGSALFLFLLASRQKTVSVPEYFQRKRENA